MKEKIKQENKAWIIKDNIVCIIANVQDTDKSIKILLDQVKEKLIKVGKRAKILIDLSGPISENLRSSQVRKKIVAEVKRWLKGVEFDKAAIFGGDTIKRTIASFLIAASGIKRVKIFEKKEQALKWLQK
jgi:hypothetical protein